MSIMPLMSTGTIRELGLIVIRISYIIYILIYFNLYEKVIAQLAGNY